MCVETLRTGMDFLPDDLLKGSHAQVYTKIKCFPSYLLGNPINVCWNPQNRAWFSKTITLRGHMQRCTLKKTNEHFPMYLLGNPLNVCWNPQNRDWFSETINLRGHMPRFTLKTVMFSHLSPWKPHKCMLKTSEQGLDFPRQSIWGVTCLGLL